MVHLLFAFFFVVFAIGWFPLPSAPVNHLSCTVQIPWLIAKIPGTRGIPEKMSASTLESMFDSQMNHYLRIDVRLSNESLLSRFFQMNQPRAQHFSR